MESLSNEVQLLILGYIDTKRDLKSLCLTSRHLRTLSLPRLYHTVYLHTANERLAGFLKCIAAGASLHLRHIRSLSFEDEKPRSYHTGRSVGDALRTEAATRDSQMRPIVSMLPENCLRAFKFVAARPLCNDIFDLLKDSQQKLQHLQLPSFDNYQSPSLTTPSSAELLDIHDNAPSKNKLMNLHHLKLYKVDADEMWNCLATGIDFSNLKTLALYDCQADNFCERFVSRLNGRSTALEHVYATLHDVNSIVDLLDCSENLTSIHLIWYEECALDRFWRMIERRGPGLKSLGVQQSEWSYPFGNWSVALSHLLSICKNVQHLRLPISVPVIRAGSWEENEHYLDFLGSRFFLKSETTWLTMNSHISSNFLSYAQFSSHTISIAL